MRVSHILCVLARHVQPRLGCVWVQVKNAVPCNRQRRLHSRQREHCGYSGAECLKERTKEASRGIEIGNGRHTHTYTYTYTHTHTYTRKTQTHCRVRCQRSSMPSRASRPQRRRTTASQRTTAARARQPREGGVVGGGEEFTRGLRKARWCKPQDTHKPRRHSHSHSHSHRHRHTEQSSSLARAVCAAGPHAPQTRA